MIVEHPPSSTPAAEGLARASEIRHPTASPTVVPCPFAEHPPEPPPRTPKLPLRAMMWNIFELGGGFYRTPTRPEYAIDAYATLIKELNIDICVILGITETIGQVPVVKKKDGHSCLAMDKAPENTGPAEVNRILEKLKAKDPDGAWECQFLKVHDKVAYHFGATTCFLHRTSKGIQFVQLDIVDCKLLPKVGATGKLVCATFRAPEHLEGEFHIAAPLGVPPAERKHEKPLPPGSATDLQKTASLPKPCLIALSAPRDLSKASSSLSEFRSSLDVAHSRPGREGSVLKDDFWKHTVKSKGGLLGNFASVDPGNVRLQDEQMHWEAMEPPKHAETTEQVIGYLADMFMICRGPAPHPVVEETRIVDLISSAIPAENLTRLRPTPDEPTPVPPPAPVPAFPKEDSCLVEQRKTYRRQDIGGPEPAQDAANELAECCYFSLVLSKHWPVVTQLRLES